MASSTPCLCPDLSVHIWKTKHMSRVSIPLIQLWGFALTLEFSEL